MSPPPWVPPIVRRSLWLLARPSLPLSSCMPSGVRLPPRGRAVFGPTSLCAALFRRHPIPGPPSLLCMPTSFHLVGPHAHLPPPHLNLPRPAADVAPRLCHNKLAPRCCPGRRPHHGGAPLPLPPNPFPGPCQPLCRTRARLLFGRLRFWPPSTHPRRHCVSHGGRAGAA
jgi:hypothetical protein